MSDELKAAKRNTQEANRRTNAALKREARLQSSLLQLKIQHEELLRLAEEQNEYIEEIMAQSRWISISERLPDHFTWVLIQLDRSGVSGDQWLAQLHPDNLWRWAGVGHVHPDALVTHWRPIPELPEPDMACEVTL